MNSIKKNVSFRLDEETIKFISVIAKNKKKTKTEVLTEIIRIAYVGLYSKPAIELNKIYIKLLKYDEERNKTKPKRE
ncbi:MAG: hypothetical protein WAU38_11455 [Ignavibacteria bacterium]